MLHMHPGEMRRANQEDVDDDRTEGDPVMGMTCSVPVRRVAVVLAAGLALLLGACAYLPAPLKRSVAVGEVEKQREHFNQIVAFRRMAELGALVTDDVEWISPSRVVSGRKNLVRAQETRVKKDPDLVQIFTTERVQRHPDWPVAAESGRWSESWQEQGEAIEMSGSYYALWTLKDGQWRLRSQILTPLSCKGEKFCKSLKP